MQYLGINITPGRILSYFRIRLNTHLYVIIGFMRKYAHTCPKGKQATYQIDKTKLCWHHRYFDVATDFTNK